MATDKQQLYVWIIIAVFFAVIIGGCNCYVAYGTHQTLTVDVTKTERVVTGSGDTLSSKYLVFTTGETFQNRDTIWYGKWNSSDIYGQITPGRYEIDVYGFRVPLFSMYRNIVAIRRVGG